MGSAFFGQTDPQQHEQLVWVPRAPDSNGGGEQGHRLVGLVYGEEVLFDASNGTIINTSAHLSHGPVPNNPAGGSWDQVYAVFKTALLVSTLNQAVSIQPMWSRDGTNWYPFGSPSMLIAGNVTASSVTVSLSTAQTYLPYVGIQATCSVAPTSGVLQGWLERLG